MLRIEPQQLQAVRFILCWVLAYSVCAAWVTKFSTRYVLPVSPLLAVLLAMAVSRLDVHEIRRWLHVALSLTSVWLLLLGAVVVTICVQLSAGWLEITVASALLAGGLVLSASGLRATGLPAALCLTALVYISFPLSFLALRHLALPDQGAQLAERLQQLSGADHKAIQIVGKPALASKIRVCSAGRATVQQSDPSDLSQISGQAVLIVSEDDLPRIDLSAYELHLGSCGVKDLNLGQLLKSCVRGELAEYLRGRRQSYIIAIGCRATTAEQLAGRPGTQLR
jgi:hypothetical protein